MNKTMMKQEISKIVDLAAYRQGKTTLFSPGIHTKYPNKVIVKWEMEYLPSLPNPRLKL